LKNLLGYKKESQVDKEVTQLVCIYDPDVPEDQEKMSHFVAVGWDKRLRIWQDDRASEEENVKASRDLPNRDLTSGA